METTSLTLDVAYARDRFPGLDDDFILMDNAGGSQTLDNVIQRISEYLGGSNVQLGASYETSKRSGKLLDEAHDAIATYLNAVGKEEIVMGASCTMVLRLLSLCLARDWSEGDEVIITNSEHEANASCWNDLSERGIVVKVWNVNDDLELDINELNQLMSEHTKLVSIVHASNILGTINPIREIADAVHANGALFCVDGTAFAPHRAIDVKAWDVDFYAFSWYKVYGPHQGVLYGKKELLERIPGINHYFIDTVPYKFQPGNFNYELTYGTAGVLDYFMDLYDHHFDTPADDRTKLEKAFELVAAHEERLSEKLLDYLRTVPDIRIIGHDTGDRNKRVPTIAFVHDSKQSDEIVEQVDPHGIGIRFGDFYAKRLVHDLDIEDKNSVVRVSFVHYNSIEEVDKLIEVFKTIL